MPCFLYVLAAYDPDDDRAYPAYACSDSPLNPDDDADRDAILRLIAQGHGRTGDGDYAEVVQYAYARLCDEGGELDRHELAAPHGERHVVEGHDLLTLQREPLADAVDDDVLAAHDATGAWAPSP